VWFFSPLAFFPTSSKRSLVSALVSTSLFWTKWRKSSTVSTSDVFVTAVPCEFIFYARCLF
jgi:hypothetical protein